MHWVLWDIVVPLLLTFAAGLATGWLLWRWRRHKLPSLEIQTPAIEDDHSGVSASSATALIEERDLAIARADKAELQAATLAQRLSQATESSDDLADTDNAESGIAGTDEKTEELNEVLAEERTSKAELEHAVMDLNNSYATLSGRRDDAMDEDNASVVDEDHALAVKDAAALQSQFEESQRQLIENNERNQVAVEQHRVQAEELKQRLADREAELAQLKEQRDEALNKHKTDQSTTPAEDSAKDQPANVHHLSNYSRNDDPAIATGAANELSGTETTSRSATTHSVNSSADARVARNVGGSTAASAVVAVDEVDKHDAPAPEQEFESSSLSTAQPEPLDDSQSQGGDTAEIPDTESAVDTVTESQLTASVQPGATGKTAAGYSPVGWDVPERTPDPSEIDNLQKIKGIGPVLEKLLHRTGIFYFRQIALLDMDGVAELDAQLPQFSGRIQRDDWVAQAESLHSEKYGQAAGC